MDKKQSELTVITRAKDLCSYIMTVTQKSPKNFRFTYVSRLQNLSMDIIENIFRANDTFVAKGDGRAQAIRLELQHKALTDLKLLAYFSLLAMEQKCILAKQYEQISRQTTDCMNLPEIKQVISSYHAHLAHGHTYKLEKSALAGFVL